MILWTAACYRQRRKRETGVRVPQQNGPHVAIVGAGFSGLLTAVNLLKASRDVRVTLIERRGVFGPGTAYDTGNPGHLLNVRLDNMSAFPDQPSHLADWLAEQPSWRAQDGFITRGVYGDYLQALLDEALDDAPDRLNLIGAEAQSIDRQDDGWRIVTSDGEVAADQIVLALGNLEPASPPASRTRCAPPAYVENPWRFDPQTARDARNVLLIGSGLTMVDAAITLRRPGRRLTALSRHGLCPAPTRPFRPRPMSARFRAAPPKSCVRSAPRPLRPIGAPCSTACAIPRATSGAAGRGWSAAASCAICAPCGTCIATACRPARRATSIPCWPAAN